MNIYLIFDKKQDIDLFDLEISQEEGCFARARLVIKAGTPIPPCGSIGIIQGDEIYFKGALVGEAIKIRENLAEIELVACPSGIPEKLRSLQKESRIPPYWDALWVKEPEKYEEIQDAHLSSFYCDRRTNDLIRSDWFEGRQLLTLHDNFFRDSFRLRLIKNPLTSCTIKVHAYWIQKEEGVLNLSASLRLAFPYSKVNTYTKEALLQKWPVPGQYLRRSGIWILKSELKEMSPPFALYPPYSPPLSLMEERGEVRTYRVKRHWFKPTLWVNWQYHQKRKETLVVTLEHAFQPLYPGEGEHKLVEFTLQNINPDPKTYLWRPGSFYNEGTKVAYQNAIYRCRETHTTKLFFEEEKWRFQKIFHTNLGHPARASFFLTDRGYQAAEHAMERAKAILARSGRAIEISVEVPWDIAKNITTDTTIILKDSRLPEGEIRGKVTKYSLMAKGETGERFGRVTLLCVPPYPTKFIPESPSHKILKETQKNRSVYDDYVEESYQVHEGSLRYTASGLSYFRYDNQVPSQVRREGSLLKGVELINGPEEQEGEMFSYRERSPSALKKALACKPTALRLHFKDLRTKETLEHVITVKMASPWSAHGVNK